MKKIYSTPTLLVRGNAVDETKSINPNLVFETGAGQVNKKPPASIGSVGFGL